jgi:hypothetical protein
MNRLECVVETMRHVLNSLAVVMPEWLREHSREEWVNRYSQRAEDYRLPEAKAKREAYAEVVGASISEGSVFGMSSSLTIVLCFGRSLR